MFFYALNVGPIVLVKFKLSKNQILKYTFSQQWYQNQKFQ